MLFLETIIMFVCMSSLTYSQFPEVCDIVELDRQGEYTDVEYCASVQEVITNHAEQPEYQAIIEVCHEYDANRDEARLEASEDRRLETCELVKNTNKCKAGKSTRPKRRQPLSAYEAARLGKAPRPSHPTPGRK